MKINSRKYICFIYRNKPDGVNTAKAIIQIPVCGDSGNRTPGSALRDPVSYTCCKT